MTDDSQSGEAPQDQEDSDGGDEKARPAPSPEAPKKAARHRGKSKDRRHGSETENQHRRGSGGRGTGDSSARSCAIDEGAGKRALEGSEQQDSEVWRRAKRFLNSASDQYVRAPFPEEPRGVTNPPCQNTPEQEGHHPGEQRNSSTDPRTSPSGQRDLAEGPNESADGNIRHQTTGIEEKTHGRPSTRRRFARRDARRAERHVWSAHPNAVGAA